MYVQSIHSFPFSFYRKSKDIELFVRNIETEIRHDERIRQGRFSLGLYHSIITLIKVYIKLTKSTHVNPETVKDLSIDALMHRIEVHPYIKSSKKRVIRDILKKIEKPS